MFADLIRAALCENVCSGVCGQRRPAQSDRGLHCPVRESLDTTECINRVSKGSVILYACAG